MAEKFREIVGKKSTTIYFLNSKLYFFDFTEKTLTLRLQQTFYLKLSSISYEFLMQDGKAKSLF